MKASLTPCSIGKCTIKNRFAMTAANLGWCEGGYVNERVISFYRARARGGCGLIIAGAAGVDPCRINQVGMMQIYDDSFVPALKKLTAGVHEEGGKIFLQLMHAGAYARRDEHGGAKALAPSAFTSPFTREEAQELDLKEIRRIIVSFGQAADRARKAGFDGVELIASAGYLIAEFLSGATNHRRDAYGGDLAGRTRFLKEVITEVRNKTGRDYPLIVRLSGTDFIPGGNGIREFLEIGKMIEDQVDAINVTGGWHESRVPQITYQVPKGQYLYLAKAMKETVSIPVIGCNRLDAASAEEAIENGFCDMAGILRGFIADPDLAAKHKKGQEDRIRPCLACNQECLERIFSCKDLRCVVNPYAGREYIDRKPAFVGKKVLVVGAGIAGMAAALLLAPDNQVVIREKSGRYGGAGRVLARVPDREETGDYIDYLFRECLYAGVSFEWFQDVKEENLKRELSQGLFDRVILADGSRKPHTPADLSEEKDRPKLIMPGEKEPQMLTVEEGARVVSAEDCILSMNPFGKKILVIGSGYKAVQTVQYLLTCGKKEEEESFLTRHAPDQAGSWSAAVGNGNTITMVDSDNRPGRGFGKSIRFALLQQLKQSPVSVISGAEILSIKKDRISCKIEDQVHEIPCDLVVMARGWKASRSFEQILADYPDRVIRIGDAKRPGRISEAVNDAWDAIFEGGRNKGLWWD